MNYLDKLNEELAVAKAEKSRLLQLCVELEQIDNRLPGKKKELEKADQKLEKELKDVERLKGLSFAAFWQAIIGNKENKIEEEEEEYVMARIQYEALKGELEEMKERKEELRLVTEEHEATKKQIERIIKNKEQVLLTSNEMVSPKLERLQAAIELQAETVDHIDTILDIGKKLKKSLFETMSIADKIPPKYRTRHNIHGQRYGGLDVNHCMVVHKVRIRVSKMQHQLKHYTNLIKDIEQRIKVDDRVNTRHFTMYVTYVNRNVSEYALQKTKGLQSVLRQTQKLMTTYSNRESATLRKLEQERLDLINKH